MKILDFAKKYWKQICVVFACLVVAGTFLYQQHVIDVKSRENAIYEQNWKASQDSLRIYEMKNRELLAAKNAFILNEQELRKQLGMTKDELKDIKKKLGSEVATISKVETIVRVDTLQLVSEPIYIDKDSLSVRFGYADEWMAMKGQMNYGHGVSNTRLESMQMDVPLTIGMTKDYQFFVETGNPYVHVTDITAGVIEKNIPKKKRWSIGVNAGFGAYYDLSNKRFGYGPGVNIGLQYHF